MDPKRTLSVSATCGANQQPTPYLPHPVIGADTENPPTCVNSNTANPTSAETPSPGAMTIRRDVAISMYTYNNPNLEHYWQSPNMVNGVNDIVRQSLTVVLGDPLLVRYFRLIFVAPDVGLATTGIDMRPTKYFIERQPTPGAEWEPWRYYADSCADKWPDIPVYTGTLSPTVAACDQAFFAGDTATQSGWGYGRQQLLYNPSSEYLEMFSRDVDVIRHFTAYAIRVQFLEPSDTVVLRSYIAIGDLKIEGHCSCFGHADTCSVTPDTVATCSCAHNTAGLNCEECLPLFNNRPWSPGYGGLANECEDCGCRGYASSCVYDEVKGYGVCQGCTTNTQGDKCEECVPYYYINPGNLTELAATPDTCTGLTMSDVPIEYPCHEYCIPCDCSRAGSQSSGNAYSCDFSSGQCVCKEFVEGRQCDQCMDEYFGLDASITSGCRPCVCTVAGTVNNTQLCNKTNGECMCKANVQGVSCNTCAPETYGLSEDNEDGCLPCDCDPGGSTAPTCHINSGQCTCRANIGGLRCNEPQGINYGPVLWQLTFDAEFANNAQTYIDAGKLIERAGHGELSSTFTGLGFIALTTETDFLEFTIPIPRTWVYKVYLRYETSGSSEVSALVSMTYNNPPEPVETTFHQCGDSTGTLTAAEISLTGETVANPSETNVMAVLQLHVVDNSGVSPCLKDGTYTLTIRTVSRTPADAPVYMDAVVLLPRETDFDVYRQTDAEMQQNIITCYDAIVNVDRMSEAENNCPQVGYSIMAELYNGAIGCLCNDVGSLDNDCSPVGGQCNCKPGVTLQDCSRCMVNYYGFDSGSGCTACNCHEGGSTVMSCSGTGVCTCRENVIGTRCDACQPQHFGLATGQGCQPCTCNLEYAWDNNCQDDGQCNCKPGVGGTNCNQCLDGYFNLTTAGCTSCECDPRGSTNTLCNQETGVCTCKTQVTGDKCDRCNPGYFALGDWSTDGCLQCFCWDHADPETVSGACTSAEGFYLGVEQDNWSLFNEDQAVQAPWGAVSGEDVEINVVITTVFPGDERAQFVMEIRNTDAAAAATDVYYLAPQKYLGDIRPSYGLEFSYTLSVHVPRLPEEENWEVWDGSGAGDILLEGSQTNFVFVAAFDTIPNENMTTFSLLMKESSWHVGTIAGESPDYATFSRQLADVTRIRIRAKYTNHPGAVVRLYNARLQIAKQGAANGNPLNNVEFCSCRTGYQGHSCEQCMPGYTHEDPVGSPESDCTPCNCRGHEDMSLPAPCDQMSGVCSCIHNTIGDHCEACAPGYYGDTNYGQPGDCKPCLCPGNVIENAINAFASTCEVVDDNGGEQSHRCIGCADGHTGDHCEECTTGYYGTPEDETNMLGNCVACQCNGRADTCNTTTGECINCQQQTGGPRCNQCMSGYWGVAGADTVDCQPCSCTNLGATGSCDPSSGICECRPNVIGNTCQQCAPNTFAYSETGCQPCECDPVGSTGVSCDVDSGQCTCRTLVTGRQCNQCEATYWNVNAATGCNECLCSEEGTYRPPEGEEPPFGVCDVESGQCTCLPETAIIGRMCDHCSPGTLETYRFVDGLFIGEYPNCELCGECFDNWARKIDDVGIAIEEAYTQAMAIWDHYDRMTEEDVAPVLDRITTNLTNVQSSIGEAQALMLDLNGLQDDYNTMMNDVEDLNSQMQNLEDYKAGVDQALSAEQQFTGIVIVNEAGTTVSTQQLHDDMVAMQTEVLAQFDDAFTSYNGIMTLTEAIRIYNGNISVFTERVNIALNTINEARDTRLGTADLWTEQQESEFTNQSVSIVLHDQTLQAMPATQAEVTSVLEQAVTLTTAANSTAVLAEQSVAAKNHAVLDELTQIEGVAFNSSAAFNMSLMAQSETVLYQELVGDLLGHTVDVILAVSSGITKATNYDAKQSEMGITIQEIDNTIIPSLTSLQSYTNQIRSASVDEAAVQQTYTDAETALNTATETLQITARAAESSQEALAQVQDIQANIQSVTDDLTVTNEAIATHDVIINDMQADITEISQNSQNALALGQEANQTIDNIDALVGDTRQCFDNEMTEATTTLADAQQAHTDVGAATVVHLRNEQLLMEVTRTAAVDSSVAAARSAELQAVQEDMDSLTADMTAITSVTDIEGLLTQLSAQHVTLTALESELVSLQNNLDSLVTALNPMTPDNTVCTLS